MSSADESREAAIEEDANMSTGNYAQWYFVDRDKLEKLGLSQYKPPKGSNFIRIVAPSSKGRFGKIVYQHQNVGANGSTYLCMKEMFDEPCAVCDHIVEMKEQKAPQKQINELGAGKRVLLFVVDVKDAETEDEGPKWFNCPPSIYISICDLSRDKRGGAIVDVSHPKNGKDIEFERKEKKGNPYGGYKLMDAKPIPAWWYEDLPQFDDVLLIPDYDKVKVDCSGIREEPKDDAKESRDGRRQSRSAKTDDDAKESRSRRESRDEKPDDDNSERSGSVKDRIEEITKRRQSRSEE